MGQEIREQNSDETPANASTNPTLPQSGTSVPLRDDRQPFVPEPLNVDRDELSPRRGPTGPRSEAGKQRSSQNAIKSGIFSQATLVKGESRSDYQSLLEGLWESLQPEGKLEEILVEKLTSISWRYRRLLVADGAEFRKHTELVDFLSKVDVGGLDRLVRYESSLERAFDRTLTQLERAQRIRRGQPLPPQLDVKIS
jgi:hypothetical protein